MSDKTITLELPELDDFPQRVVHEAARQLLEVWTIDPDDGSEYSRPSKVAEQVTRQVENAIQEIAREQVPALLAKILERKLELTDRFGYSRSGSATVEEVILEETRNAVRHVGGRSGPSVLENVVREQIQGELRKHLEAVIEEARAPIIEAMRKEATGVFERAMRSGLAGLSGS